MSAEDTCGIIFRGHQSSDPKDSNGCIKPYSHNDAHEFVMKDGRHVEWEDDYECNCGCHEEEDGRPCFIYQIIEPSKPSKQKE